MLQLVRKRIEEGKKMSDCPVMTFDANTKMLRGFPQFQRNGAVSPNGEMTPFVHKGRLYRMELNDPTGSTDFGYPTSAMIRDVETGKVISYVGEDCYYYSAYVEDDMVYVLGTERLQIDGEFRTTDTIYAYVSTDLIHWDKRVLMKKPGWGLLNTALTKGPDGYVLLTEFYQPEEYVGPYPYSFTISRSKDLVNWEFDDPQHAFFQDRYMGGPWMRYAEGWYYVISVTQLPCTRYTNYIYRTKDFRHWEDGLYNPLLSPTEEDRVIAPYAVDLDEEKREAIKTGFLISSSDIDMCDWNGKTYINYLVGNQLGFYYMTEAIYDGTVTEFLKAQFE